MNSQQATTLSDKQSETHTFPKNPPNEIVQHIFRYLDLYSLLTARRINSYFKENADALMRRPSYWISTLTALEPEAAILLLEKLYLVSAASGKSADIASASNSIAVTHRYPFKLETISEIWLGSSESRNLRDKILMSVFCHRSRTLNPIELNQIFIDFWSSVAAEIDNEIGEASTSSTEKYMSLFSLHLYILHNRFTLSHSLALPERVFDNKDFIEALITLDASLLSFASDTLKQTKSTVLRAFRYSGWALEFASESLKQDEDIVLTAVTQTGPALQFTCDALKENERIVLAAVNQDGRSLDFASESLKNNRDIVLAAVQECGSALQFSSSSLKDDETIVLAAVSQQARALRFASQRLQENREFVMTLVRQNGIALKYASDSFKDNEPIVLEAIHQNGRALKFASDRLKNEETIVLNAIIQNEHTLKHASDRIKNDGDFLIKAVEANPKIRSIITKNNYTDVDRPRPFSSFL